jgi:hypothetical protein
MMCSDEMVVEKKICVGGVEQARRGNDGLSKKIDGYALLQGLTCPLQEIYQVL